MQKNDSAKTPRAPRIAKKFQISNLRSLLAFLGALGVLALSFCFHPTAARTLRILASRATPPARPPPRSRPDRARRRPAPRAAPQRPPASASHPSEPLPTQSVRRHSSEPAAALR